MDNSNPHINHSYSQDQILATAFDHELRNNLKLNPKYDNVREIVESYLKERVSEIKTRWAS